MWPCIVVEQPIAIDSVSGDYERVGEVHLLER